MNTRPVVPTLAAAPTKNQRLGQFCAASSERRVSSFADEYVANGHRRILLLCRTAKYRKKSPICSWFVLNSDRLLGFWIGRELGYGVLLRYGRYLRLTAPRIKLGQYLFLRHGGKVVFFGRFVAVLRALAAFLAGANRMTWLRFVTFNAAGGVVWAAAYGAGAYLLGEQVHRVLGPVGMGLLVVTLVLMVAGFVFLRRHENRLEAEAERALPGPLVPVRHRR